MRVLAGRCEARGGRVRLRGTRRRVERPHRLGRPVGARRRDIASSVVDVWLVVAAAIGLVSYDALQTVRLSFQAAVEVSGGGERLEGLSDPRRRARGPGPRTSRFASSAPRSRRTAGSSCAKQHLSSNQAHVSRWSASRARASPRCFAPWPRSTGSPAARFASAPWRSTSSTRRSYAESWSTYLPSPALLAASPSTS